MNTHSGNHKSRSPLNTHPRKSQAAGPLEHASQEITTHGALGKKGGSLDDAHVYHGLGHKGGISGVVPDEAVPPILGDDPPILITNKQATGVLLNDVVDTAFAFRNH